MYVSSDGTKKDVESMNYEYIVNALSKALREVFESKDVSEYNKYVTNIQILYNEAYSRIEKFLAEKIDDEEWI